MNLPQWIHQHYGPSLDKIELAVWSLPLQGGVEGGTFDLDLVEELLTAGASLRLYDPTQVLAWALAAHGKCVGCCDGIYGTVERTDGLIVGVPRPEFRRPDFELLRRLMRSPVLFDACALYDPAEVVAAGLTYISGR